MNEASKAMNHYRVRINTGDAEDLWQWAVRLNVTPAKLQHAISLVGDWSDDVQFELSRSQVDKVGSHGGR